MHRSTRTATSAFRAVAQSGPLPKLAPYQRCACGVCATCKDDAKWDRIFAKFESREREERGIFQSTINDL